MVSIERTNLAIPYICFGCGRSVSQSMSPSGRAMKPSADVAIWTMIFRRGMSLESPMEDEVANSLALLADRNRAIGRRVVGSLRNRRWSRDCPGADLPGGLPAARRDRHEPRRASAAGRRGGGGGILSARQ